MTITCHVWWAVPVDPASAPHLLSLLDSYEQDRLARFRHTGDRARYLAAHALTRLVLADATGRPAGALAFDRICRCGRQHGKPVLPGGPAFSFSHAGDVVGVAVHGAGPIGLDVEQERPLGDLASLARHVSSPAEAAPVTPSAFFRAWTRKEALLKATGEGLSSPMTGITLGPDGLLDWTGDGAPDGAVWLRDLQPAPDYPAAVAGLGGTAPTITEEDGDAVLARLGP